MVWRNKHRADFRKPEHIAPLKQKNSRLLRQSKSAISSLTKQNFNCVEQRSELNMPIVQTITTLKQ